MSANLLFDKQKLETLKTADLSRKGSFDQLIDEFLRSLNTHNDYFTLSSCSGRIVLLKSQKNANKVNKKKGCQWLICSHEPIQCGEIWKHLNDEPDKDKESSKESEIGGVTTLKFEPFILHVQCRDLSSAKVLHTLSLESGYRNSGLTVGKAGKIVLAVRSTHGLEVPLTDHQGNRIVDERYVDFITEEANIKLADNERRIRKYEIKCNEKLFKIDSCKNQHVNSFETLEKKEQRAEVPHQEND